MIISLIIGLFVGIIAKFLMPGRDPGGFIVTIILGIAGSAVAGWIGQSTGAYMPNQAPGFIASVLGAMLLLFIYRMFLKRKA